MTLPDHFAVFGLPERFTIDLAELESAYLRLSKETHPDRHATADAPTRLAAVQKSTDLNAAYKILRDDFSRAEHLLRRRGIETSEQQSEDNRATVDAELLMEVMELREALANARTSKDRAAIETLTAEVQSRSDRAWKTIRDGFAAIDEGDRAPLRKVAAEMVSLRYYRRFLEEVDAMEDA